MIYLNAFILAIVEGVTEFLPISSTGHMILVEQYLPITADPASPFRHAFIELIQLPAICAVAVYFFRRLNPLMQPPEERRTTYATWMTILVAFIPAAVLGKLFKKTVEHYLFFDIPVAIALIVGGVILIVLERRQHSARYTSTPEVPIKSAFGIGLFQCLAFFPGTSRSAATIIGAMLLGMSRAAAAEFSFFLAIPTMFAAAALTILEVAKDQFDALSHDAASGSAISTLFRVVETGLGFSSQQWGLLALGSVISFLTAYASVAFLMRYIQRHDFTVFGVYRIILGGIVLLAHFV